MAMAAGTVVAITAVETAAGTVMVAEAAAAAAAVGRIGGAVDAVAGGARAAERETPASIAYPAIRTVSMRRRCRPLAGQQTTASGSM
jgi:hypothetical protein